MLRNDLNQNVPSGNQDAIIPVQVSDVFDFKISFLELVSRKIIMCVRLKGLQACSPSSFCLSKIVCQLFKWTTPDNTNLNDAYWKYR